MTTTLAEENPDRRQFKSYGFLPYVRACVRAYVCVYVWWT